MRLPIAGLLAAVTLAGCQAQPPAPTIADAWVRLPAVAGRPGAAYFTLTGGRNSVTLVSVRSPAAIRSELHESMAGHSGAMTMMPLKQVHVPAAERVAFAPGGRHVMLFDVNPTLRPGGKTTLTLAFADGTTVDTQAAVRGAGDPAP